MIIQPIHPILKVIVIWGLSLGVAFAEKPKRTIDGPNEYQLERIVGVRLETAVSVRAWNAPEPQRTNTFIYSVAAPQLNNELIRRVAAHFGVKGEIEQIRGDTLGYIGYWIREHHTDPKQRREVKYWLTIGNFSYGTGDNGYRYDPKTKTYPISRVPTKEEAKAKALELLPLLGLGTNDLQHRHDGRLDTASSADTVRYTDKSDGQRKTVVKQQNVSFWQRVPGGGKTVGVGDGGSVRFSFVSEGKVSGIELFFRKMEKAGEAKPKTTEQIIRDLRNRNAWTWHQSVPDSVTVTNCVLAYPQGNSWLHQAHVWPFYMVTGMSSGGRAVTFYVPLEW